MDWLLVLGLEEGLVECATLCIKSWVILVSSLDQEILPTEIPGLFLGCIKALGQTALC